MININKKHYFTFCFEKNSYQFSYFFSNKMQLEYFFNNLLFSIGIFSNDVNANINFYNTIIYAEIYTLKQNSLTPSTKHIFFAIKKIFYILRITAPNLKVFLYNLDSKGQNNISTESNSIEFLKYVIPCYNNAAANLIAKLIANSLIQSITHQQIFEKYIKAFSILFQQQNNKQLLGARFELKGRINGIDRSKKLVKIFGSVSFQKQNNIINYGFAEAFTPSGKCGVHVWYNLKNI